MKPTSELIHLLADQGHDLQLTLHQDGGDRRTRHYIISKPDGSSVHAQAETGLTATLLELRDMLSHHPRAVTINGAPVERTSFNGLATLTRHHHPELTSNRQTTSTVPMGPGTHLPPNHNAFTEGVSYHLDLPGDFDQEPYHSIHNHQPAHWHPLDLITPNPVLVITLSQWQAASQASNERLTTDPALIRQAQKRARETCAHPHAPKRWHGPVHHYYDPTGRHRTAPIAVPSTPVLMDKLASAQEIPILLSIAHALYSRDAGLVPVANPKTRTPWAAQPRHLANASFAWLTPVEPSEAPNMARTEDIILSVNTDGQGPPKHLPAPVLMTGDPIALRTLFVQRAVSPEQLAELIQRAKAQPASQADEAILADAKIAHAGRERALMDQVQEHLDAIARNFVPGQLPLTTSSHDGRITATITAPAHVG